MSATNSPYLTLPEAADYLRMSADAIGDHARAGRIRAIRTERRWLFKVADLEAYASARQNRKPGRAS